MSRIRCTALALFFTCWSAAAEGPSDSLSGQLSNILEGDPGCIDLDGVTQGGVPVYRHWGVHDLQVEEARDGWRVRVTRYERLLEPGSTIRVPPGRQTASSDEKVLLSEAVVRLEHTAIPIHRYTSPEWANAARPDVPPRNYLVVESADPGPVELCFSREDTADLFAGRLHELMELATRNFARSYE